jgi:glycosyltransferase involved in cell wall biosynthesis
MIFHLLGSANIPTNREIVSDGFGEKTIKLARLFKSQGHTVYFYGGEDSTVECDEFIQCISEEERHAVYGDYDWKTNYFKGRGPDPAYQIFNARAIQAINARKEKKDFLLCPGGSFNKPIADAVDLMTVEPGIGYEGVFSKFKVFESYAWMHYIYGRLGQSDGGWYDAVIPSLFDETEFPLCIEKEDYFLFVGRHIQRKGLDIAVQVTKALSTRLIVVGQGKLVDPAMGVNITEPHVEHLGIVSHEKRASLMGHARAVFMPSYYLEPFGNVAIESMMCGTPVLTTDWGGFSETIQHGVTGYRCRTFEEFAWAAQHAGELDPVRIRDYTVANYSIGRIGRMYEEYWARLSRLWDGDWYSENPGRTNLNWLKRYQSDEVY